MTQFRYLTVDDWGGIWVRPPATEHLPDGEIYVHHVGGGAWMGGPVGVGEAASRQAAINVFLALNLYATRPRDQGGKDYSFLDYDALGWYDRRNDIGWIAEGRGPYRSAATADRNEEGEAFCMCGNYTLREPLPAELELCARGIVYMADQGWTTRTAVIYGHRDNPAHPGATGCPGDHFYAELPTIRARVAALLAPPQIPTTPPEDIMRQIELGPFVMRLDKCAAVVYIHGAAARPVTQAEANANASLRAAVSYVQANPMPYHNETAKWLEAQGIDLARIV